MRRNAEGGAHPRRLYHQPADGQERPFSGRGGGYFPQGAGSVVHLPDRADLGAKRRIMEVYLNVAETGIGTYGVEAGGAALFRHFRPARFRGYRRPGWRRALPLPKGNARSRNPGGWLARHGKYHFETDRAWWGRDGLGRLRLRLKHGGKIIRTRFGEHFARSWVGSFLMRRRIFGPRVPDRHRPQYSFRCGRGYLWLDIRLDGPDCRRRAQSVGRPCPPAGMGGKRSGQAPGEQPVHLRPEKARPSWPRSPMPGCLLVAIGAILYETLRPPRRTSAGGR